METQWRGSCEAERWARPHGSRTRPRGQCGGLRELGWGEGQCWKSLEQGSDTIRLLVKGPPGISGEAEGQWQ